MDELVTLVNRLKKLNIELDLVGNFPWIYLERVNGKEVEEKFEANHGFCIAFVKPDNTLKLASISEIFKILRKYK
jgi:hypothetical protein